MTIRRRLRGFAATVLLWGVGGAVAVTLLGAIGGLWSPVRLEAGMLRRFLMMGATWGALCGAGFALLVMARHGRRLRPLTPAVAARWGGVAGGLLGALGLGLNVADGISVFGLGPLLAFPIFGALAGWAYVRAARWEALPRPGESGELAGAEEVSGGLARERGAVAVASEDAG